VAARLYAARWLLCDLSRRRAYNGNGQSLMDLTSGDGAMVILLPILVVVLAVFGFILWGPLGEIRRLRGAPTLPIAALPSSGPAKAAGRAGGSALLSRSLRLLASCGNLRCRNSVATARCRSDA